MNGKPLSKPARTFLVGLCLFSWMAPSLPAEGQALPRQARGKIWIEGSGKEGFTQLTDQDNQTYAVLSPAEPETPVAVGLEWDEPALVNGCRVAFASLNGIFLEADPDHQAFEFFDGTQWRSLETSIRIDYTRSRQIAPYQKAGSVLWDIRFPPITARGLRLVMTRAPSQVKWEQVYAVQEVAPFLDPEEQQRGARLEIIAKPEKPSYPENLLAGAYTPRLSWDGVGGIIEWPRSRMLDQIRVSRSELPGPIHWWDGRSWRTLSIDAISKPPSGGTLTAVFPPVAVHRLRLVGLPAEEVDSIQLSSRARAYFEAVFRSGEDLLMRRVTDEPDLAQVQTLLLPLDMQTAVIGRPGDEVECMVHWDGTLVEVENGEKGAWNTGANDAPPGKEEWIDRWFAFAVGNIPLGEDPALVRRSYISGFMPGVITRHEKDPLAAKLEVFTTAPGDQVYGQVLEVTVTNHGDHAVQAPFSLILGRRKSAEAAHRRGADGQPPNPMNFFPMPTGYSVDRSSRVVRNANNDIILFADTDAVWEGSDLEGVLTYPSVLAPGESRRLRFLMPSVNQPLRETAVAEQFDFQSSRLRFEDYWRGLLEERSMVRLPEPGLDDLYKNLLAQTFTSLIDGKKLKYGAYWYESYFGLEEGWPIVALAQFGHSELAEELLEIMLSPELLDSSNYHHQYRNGLAPMYAAQTYRLTRNRDWLARIRPRLVATAEWIMQARHDDLGKSEAFRGLLPKHAYGGDISTPAYSLYSNATCWRGLRDTGYLMKELGDSNLAERFLEDARAYRERILELADRQLDRQFEPPFLPLAWEIGSPDEEGYKEAETAYSFIPDDPLGNYWILFAPLLLETGIFPADTPQNRWVTDFMEQRGGLLAGLARFHRGVDHIYGFGYPLQSLRRGQRQQFLAVAYSVLAHGHSRDSFTGPEVAGVFPLRVDNSTHLEEYKRYVWQWDLYARGWTHGDFGYSVGSEPLSAAAGVGLQLIRAMLVDERMNAEMESEGVLDLLRMAPAHWLEHGKEIHIERLPTHFGPLTLDLRSRITEGEITARIELPPVAGEPSTVLWLNRPDPLPIREVLVDEQSWTDFTSNSVTLPVRAGSMTVKIVY